MKSVTEPLITRSTRLPTAPPKSFPAKLLLVLKARFEAGQPGVTVVPCELFEQNSDKLRGLVMQLATSWNLPDALTRWLTDECLWLNTLVDRIVSGSVTDFIDVYVGTHHWPTFNAADSAITIGIVLLMIDAFFPRRADPVPES